MDEVVAGRNPFVLDGWHWFAGAVTPKAGQVKWLSARWSDWQARRARNAYYGACAVCRHDWREHMPDEGCGECQYEIDHEAPGAPLTPCTEQAPGVTF